MVLIAARKAGAATPGGGSGRSLGPVRSTFGRGRAGFGRSRLFGSNRRVIVKARVVRNTGLRARSAPLAAHLSYLKRDGTSREGERGAMFDAAEDRADDRAFAERCEDDRHHFRFIVSPEDASEMSDLKAFTRDLVQQMEADLGTRLDWVAAEHWNTDNPHVHLLVRGVDETGADLVIARDYISHGLRSRAEDLVSIELGPRPEHAIRSALEGEMDLDRWTRLDIELRSAADETGLVDLRRPEAGLEAAERRRLLIGRLQKLERMGLATPEGPARWTVSPESEQTLRALGRRGDIIAAMHRDLSARDLDRGVADYVIEAHTTDSAIVGRLVSRGLHDELTGEAYAVIDGVDGRAHHVRFRGLEAFDQAPPNGGIVEVRRFGGPDDPSPTLILATRSDLDLDRQVTAPGSTWLDHRLVEREPMALSLGGFGGEVREALQARTEHLITQGLARRVGDGVAFERDLLATLRQRELDAVSAKLSQETGLTRKPDFGGSISGVYRQRLTLSSGRYAMIDDGLSFQLAPWSTSLEKKLGQQVSGSVRDDGGIAWTIGRRRGLAI